MATFKLSDGKEYDIVDRGATGNNPRATTYDVRQHDGNGHAIVAITFEWEEPAGLSLGTIILPGVRKEIIQEARERVLRRAIGLARTRRPT